MLAEYGNVSKHTFVDKVFGGVFISSVLCHDCHVVCIFSYLLSLSVFFCWCELLCVHLETC